MPPKRSPHILVICTDQHRYDALGCYGNTHIQTPAIDQLAREGLLFEQCYTQNPVCAPARASLLTGRYPRSHGLWANGVALPPGVPLLGHALTDAGYDCGLVGKLHLGAVANGRTERRHQDGFRYFEWAHDPVHTSPDNRYHQWLAQHHPDLYAAAVAATTAPKTAGGAQPAVSFVTMPTEAHYSRWAADAAIEFLRAARNPEKPFFLWLNFFDPHHPFSAPPEYRAKYDPEQLPRPIGGPGELASKPAIHSEASRESYAGRARGFASYSPAEVQATVAAYYAMVTLVDDEIQRVLEALDETGERDQTLVVFTSDHGEMLGDHQLMLKGPMMYEGAVHVPLIMRWPHRLPGEERIGDLVQSMDLCPTILEAAGVPPLPGNQARSLLPLALRESDAAPLGWALCEYRNSGTPYEPPVDVTMLRRGRHKLVVYHGTPATSRPRNGELYDLEEDPQELHNLWNEPQHLGLRLDLQEALLDVLVATEDRSQPREASF